jgi:hypothetical protein
MMGKRCYTSCMERTVWHDGMDWSVRKDGVLYWYRPIDADEWTPGVPPGMDELDIELLVRFEQACGHIQNTPTGPLK